MKFFKAFPKVEFPAEVAALGFTDISRKAEGHARAVLVLPDLGRHINFWCADIGGYEVYLVEMCETVSEGMLKGAREPEVYTMLREIHSELDDALAHARKLIKGNKVDVRHAAALARKAARQAASE
jgi:hypothetical protein